MSRASRRRTERESTTTAPGAKQPYWILAGSVGAALLVVTIVAEVMAPGVHPEPRAEAHAPHVMPAERYASYVRAEAAYEMAAQIPQVIDGLYCYCFCSFSCSCQCCFC